MKQNGIKKNFKKFTFKPHSAYYTCSFMLMTLLMLRQFNYSKCCNLIGSLK